MKMLKETETEETIVFFVAFLSMVAFQLGRGPGPLGPPALLATPMYFSIKLLKGDLSRKFSYSVFSKNLRKILEVSTIFNEFKFRTLCSSRDVISNMRSKI